MELIKKDTITSLDLLKEINYFRLQTEDKKELRHDTLRTIIKDEFEEEINSQEILEIKIQGKTNSTKAFNLTLNQAKQVLVRESKIVRKAVIKKLDELSDKTKELSVPQTYAQALLEAGRLALENEKLQLQAKQNAPRVEFAKSVEVSADSILVREFSKILANDGIKLGQNKLFKWFRDNKYLNRSNEPYQRFIEQGLFEVKEKPVNTVKGNLITFTTKITGKGQIYFLNKIKED